MHLLRSIKPSPTNDPFVKAVLQGGLCRILALPTVKKRPFTSEMLNDTVQVFQTGSSLGDFRLMATCQLNRCSILVQ